jgi:hypothetical protein
VEGIVKIVERCKGEVEGLFRWFLACGKTWPLSESLSLLCAIDPAFEVSSKILLVCHIMDASRS